MIQNATTIGHHIVCCRMSSEGWFFCFKVVVPRAAFILKLPPVVIHAGCHQKYLSFPPCSSPQTGLLSVVMDSRQEPPERMKSYKSLTAV